MDTKAIIDSPLIIPGNSHATVKLIWTPQEFSGIINGKMIKIITKASENHVWQFSEFNQIRGTVILIIPEIPVTEQTVELNLALEAFQIIIPEFSEPTTDSELFDFASASFIIIIPDVSLGILVR